MRATRRRNAGKRPSFQLKAPAGTPKIHDHCCLSTEWGLLTKGDAIVEFPEMYGYTTQSNPYTSLYDADVLAYRQTISDSLYTPLVDCYGGRLCGSIQLNAVLPRFSIEGPPRTQWNHVFARVVAKHTT